MKKIIIASDSFKGSVTSMEVANAAEKAIFRIYKDCTVVKTAVADGGEGTVDALVEALNGKIISCTVKGPLLDPVKARYGILGDEKTAVIEMATASGLTLINENQRNPLLTSTFGTGELIKDALARGCQKLLIGIGGSATNDAGTGMLQALGFRFFDENGNELDGCGENLSKIVSIDHSHILPQLKNAEFTIACDVKNPFTGPNGASHIFARQKGADEEMILKLEDGMKKFAKYINEKEGKNIEDVPGAGAAGGLGGGFLAFLNAKLKPGVEMVLEIINFNKIIENADLVITGEGKVDKQTAMGKAPGGVLKAASKKNIPVIALGGCVEDVKELNHMGFLAVFPILPFPVTLEIAMQKEFTLKNITRTLEQYLRAIKYFNS